MIEVPGRHYETGTITNALNLGGHAEVSEALVLGMSGGIAFGYFIFEYKGHLPHVALLARNTFDPFNRALDNLGVQREVRTFTSAAKAEDGLRLELDSGHQVIVWADCYSLPHNGLISRKDMWAMMPLLVMGYEGDTFQVADGSRQLYTIDAATLGDARVRVKKDRFKAMTVSSVNKGHWQEGVRNGLQCAVSLYLDAPPAGSAKNFGSTGIEHWEEMLTNQRNKRSWARCFPTGPKLYQALAGMVGQPGVFDWIETWGTQDAADRETFADFLVEAAKIIGEAELAKVALSFRESAVLWRKLADQTLPDDVPNFAEAKRLKRKVKKLVVGQGERAEDEIKELRTRMTELWDDFESNPIEADKAQSICHAMSETVSEIGVIETSALKRIAQVLS